jgi:hypothetical protein
LRTGIADADAANAAAAADDDTDAANPATQQPHLAGRSLHWPPALGAGAGAARGGREGVVKRLLARPKADAD